ncbi:MAG: hypothetical protein ACK2U1_17610 [Anaerolineales bacterium]
MLPTGLAFDSANDAIWVADSGNNRFMRFPLNQETLP